MAPVPEGVCWVWKHEKKQTANLRELTRIAFFLRRRALLRLIAYAGITRRLEKCWGKTGVPVFLSVTFSFCVIIKIMKQQKNPHAGFSDSIFQERVRFLRRRLAEAEHPNVRKMRFALIRGDSRLNILLCLH
jgi:hypothetical protein